MPNEPRSRLGFWINGHPWCDNDASNPKGLVWALTMVRGPLDMERTVLWFKSDGSIEPMSEGMRWLAEGRKAGRL